METAEKRVTDYIEDHKEELYNFVSKLVQIDSQNQISAGGEENCKTVIFSEFEKLGLKAEMYYPDQVEGIKNCPDYLEGRGTDKRPNFAGTYVVEKPERRIMLAAHTDTMPVGERELWSVDPLGGTRKDGRIYGRGSNDNKFGIASSLMALEAIIASGLRLKSEIVFEAYCDEEYGGGNGALAASLRNRYDSIINTDGGNYEIWSRSMGGQGIGIKVVAKEPQDSAELVLEGLRIVQDGLKGFFRNRYQELDKDPYYHATDMQRSAVRIHEFKVGNQGCDLDFGNMDFVYYSNSSKEILQKELEEAEQSIKNRLDKMRLYTDGFYPTTRFFYCLTLPSSDEMLQTLKKAAEDAAGKEIKITGSCMTDLSLFLKYGSPQSVNFGILRDFKLYGGAHQPDEFVDEGELLNHCKALALFLIRCSVIKN